MHQKSISNFFKSKWGIFAIYCCIFFALLFVSLFFVYNLQTFSNYGFFHGDSGRVFSDMIIKDSNHYRTSVHPIFVLLIQPLANFINIFFRNDVVSCTVLITLFAVLNLFIFSCILKTLNRKSNILLCIFICIYLFSFAFVQNLLMLETFVFGCFSCSLFCLFFLKKNGQVINKFDIIILVCLGILSLSITTTNFIIYLVGIAFMFLFKKQKGKRFWKNIINFCSVIVLSIFSTWLLSCIQSAIFPSCQNWLFYLRDVFRRVILKDSTVVVEEVSYISSGSFLTKVITQFKTFFGFSFFAGKTAQQGTQYSFSGMSTITLVGGVFIVCLMIFSLALIIKNKKYKDALPFIVMLLSNCFLHCFYGSSELILYSLNLVYLILIIMFIGLSQSTNKIVKGIVVGLCALIIGLEIIGIIPTLITSARFLNITANMKFSFFFKAYFKTCFITVAIVSCYFVVYYLAKLFYKKKLIIKENFNVFVLLSFSLLFIVQTICSPFCIIAQAGTQNDDKYPDNVVKSFYFGMGLRDKYIIKETETGFILYNYQTKETMFDNIKSVDYDAVNYFAQMTLNDNSKIDLWENESGLYLREEDNISTLSSISVNIPTFEGYEHRKYLRMLFNEVMVNILPTGPTPNLENYGNVWYRDCAIMGMVLKETNNLNHIEAWIESLDENDVYDYARSENIKEADNLGELLYILSLCDNPNQNLIDAILEEANRISSVYPNSGGKKYISGITDFANMKSYPTKLLIHGLTELGLDSSQWIVPEEKEGYYNICWFYNTEPKENMTIDFNGLTNAIFTTERYPYLNIAILHYYQIKFDFTTNVVPISKELTDWNQVIPKWSTPHAWCAAEMFLYLLDYANYS